MRITKEQLQEMIDEEVAHAVLKSENRRLIEAHSTGGVYDMDVHHLLEFAAAYATLDFDARAELRAAVSGRRRPSFNSLSLIEGRLGGINRELDEVLAAWNASVD